MSYSIDTSNRFIRVICEETLNRTDVQVVSRRPLIIDGNELSFTNHIIVDIRKLDLSKIGYDELMTMAEYLRNIQLPRKIKSAIITINSLQYGIVRMFQTILEDEQIEVKIFSNDEEAYNWLAAMD
jgi:hypothetical protein